MKNFIYYFNLNGSFKKTIKNISGVFIYRGRVMLIGNEEIHGMNDSFFTKVDIPYNMSKLQIKKYQNYINKKHRKIDCKK